MNVKLLRKVKKHILEEPKRLDMWSWLVKPDQTNGGLIGGREFAKCQTAACVAGWAVLLSGEQRDPDDIERRATELLGLNEDQAKHLFDPSCWPDKYNQGIARDGSKETAESAAARIEHFIKTKGAE